MRLRRVFQLPFILSILLYCFSLSSIAQEPTISSMLVVGDRTSTFTGQGFDKCEIPTLSQLQTWITDSPYRVVNLYIGGSRRACANTALTASYVSQLSRQGWKFIPTWVGPQCLYNDISDDLTTAYNQGVAEANAAVAAADSLGLTLPNSSGTIIYYDMEGYTSQNPDCRDSAKSFIEGWTAQLHTTGNLSGVYGSSCAANISDFASISDVPDAIWPAGGGFWSSQYDANATVWGNNCVADSLWSNHTRIYQYTSGHSETWGGVSLTIDSDVIDGIVADTSIFFSDTFLDGDFGGWTVVDAPGAISGPSEWAVVEAKGSLVLRQDSNIYIQTPPPYEGTYVYTGESNWTDYHLNVDIEPDDNDGVFVIFRYVNDDNHYRFIMDRERNYRRLEKKVNGSYTTLAEDLTAGYGDEWLNVHIIVEGEEITVLFNFTPIFLVTDSSLSSGMIGLGTWGSTDCHFDNVIVAATGIDPYADRVVDSHIKSVSNSHPDPTQTLGATHGAFGYTAIGGPGYWLILDMGLDEEIIDGVGNDIRVHEIGAIFGGEDEEYDVSVANSPTGPWTYLGQAWTTSEFDLASSGLNSVRYIRIDDLSTRTVNPPGSDIDAIHALNMEDAPILNAPSENSINYSNNDVILNWIPIAHAIGYNIYASHLGGSVGFSNIGFVPTPNLFASANIAMTDSLSHTHQDAADDNLFYVITAIDSKGFESRFSTELPYSSELLLPVILK